MEGMCFRIPVLAFMHKRDSCSAHVSRSLVTCSAEQEHNLKVWSRDPLAVSDDASRAPAVAYHLARPLVGHQKGVWDAACSSDSAYVITGFSFLSVVLVRWP